MEKIHGRRTDFPGIPGIKSHDRQAMGQSPERSPEENSREMGHFSKRYLGGPASFPGDGPGQSFGRLPWRASPTQSCSKNPGPQSFGGWANVPGDPPGDMPELEFATTPFTNQGFAGPDSGGRGYLLCDSYETDFARYLSPEP